MSKAVRIHATGGPEQLKIDDVQIARIGQRAEMYSGKRVV